MTRIGLFYSTISQTTKSVALLIQNEFGKQTDLHDIAYTKPERILEYDFLILGTPTWDEEGIDDDMVSFISQLGPNALLGKKVALFGLGDQRMYPDLFQNAMGKVYRQVKQLGATVIGKWPTIGYKFDSSTAVEQGHFAGLAVDEDNEVEKTINRVEIWTQMIKNEFAEGVPHLS